MKVNMLLIFTLTFLCSCMNLKDIDNPFNLLDDDDIKNEISDVDNPFKLVDDEIPEKYELDDETNPFSLVYTKKLEYVPRKNRESDVLSHLHLVKILRNKIILEETGNNSFPAEVIFRLTLSKTLVEDIETYIQNPNSSLALSINQHILHYLRREESQPEVVFDYEKKASILEHTYIKLFIFLVVGFFFTKKPWMTGVLLLAWGVWHQDWSMHQDKELRQQYEVNMDVPRHCKPQATSTWNSLLRWFTKRDDDECYKHYKTINSGSQQGNNPVFVAAALITNTMNELLKPVGDLIGHIYKGLNSHMPFFMAFGVIVVILILFVLFVLGVCFLMRKYPSQNVPPIPLCNCHQQRNANPSRLKRAYNQHKPKMIHYK